MPAEECARQILQGVAREKEEITIGAPREKMMIYLKRFSPGLLTKMLVRRAAGASRGHNV
jgi:hypothetical protein